MLVRNRDHGRELARTLGQSKVSLMRGMLLSRSELWKKQACAQP
ncbi:hypothetical protein [Achromobacter xylosoxidans]|nr:hypothetical protein [Achromobacter xylosoxidans]